MTRVGERYSKFFCVPRFSSQSCSIPPTESSAVMIIAVITGSSIFAISLGGGNFVGLSTSTTSGGCGDAVTHAGRGGDEVDAEFALQPLLGDLHVQQAEKSAAKTEAEGHGILRLVKKRRVIQLQFAEGVAQVFVVGGQHGKQPRKHHGFGGFKTGQLRRGP